MRSSQTLKGRTSFAHVLIGAQVVDADDRVCRLHALEQI